MEGENPEAATNDIPEANDVVMDEANLEPTVANAPVANEANEAHEADDVNAAPDTNLQSEVNATALVLPPRHILSSKHTTMASLSLSDGLF